MLPPLLRLGALGAGRELPDDPPVDPPKPPRSHPPRFHPPPPMKMGAPNDGPKNPPDAPAPQALVKAENQMATISTKMAIRTTRLPMG